MASAINGLYMRGNNTDIIFLHDLHVFGKHGVYEEERNVEQEFIIDVSATIDTTLAAKSDNLKDTVDYVQFKNIAEEIIQGISCYLVEKIGEDIAKRVLEDKRIVSVVVTIKKPAVLKNGLPGVTITRTR